MSSAVKTTRRRPAYRADMAMHPWTDNVRYYEFTPTTIHYDLQLDAFYVARADVRTPEHPYALALVIAVTARHLTANNLSVGEAIRLARVRLDQLIEQHRGVLDSLGARTTRVYDLAGIRLR
jgi:hypothetical protein